MTLDRIGCRLAFVIRMCFDTITRMDKRIAAYIVALLAGCLTLDAGAQVYRCKTPTGGTEYSQVPCGTDAQLVQSQRDSIDTTNPPADPFGVKRERERLQSETNRYNKKFYDDMAAQKAAPTGSLRVARQIDPAACERADRDLQIQYRHARKDEGEIRRKEKVADWECGRSIADDPVAAAPPQESAPPPQPVAVPPGPAFCNATGCWGDGGRYFRKGTSDTYISPNGTACRQIGQRLVCP